MPSIPVALAYADSIAPQATTSPAVASSTPKATKTACDQFRPIIKQYDWDVDLAIKICNAESSGQHRQVFDNPPTRDYSVGLFQINLYGDLKYKRPTEEELKKPDINIAFAYKLYKSGEWKPWGVCWDGKVKCW